MTYLVLAKWGGNLTSAATLQTGSMDMAEHVNSTPSDGESP